MPDPIDSTDAPPIKVVIVEDDVQVLHWLQQAITSSPDIQIQAAVGTRAQGLALLHEPSAHVLLVDLGLPDGSGIDVIQMASRQWPGCAIMVITTFGDEGNVMRSLQAGATGYLLKDSTPRNILNEIRSLHKGGSPISPLIARKILTRFVKPDELVSVASMTPSIVLSSREHETLELITKGFSVDEIAQLLSVSKHTVQTFIRRIYNKLEVNSRSQAIHEARQQGLIND
jgi:DNA-binding NarL/FixJ family response regulator